MNASCPKCASRDLEPLAGLQSDLRPGVGPPKRRLTEAWALLTAVLTLASIREAGAAREGAIAFLALTCCAALLAWSAHHFNSRELPRLMRDWSQKLVCRKCGNVAPGEQR